MRGIKKFWLVVYLLITGLFFLATVVFGVVQVTGIYEIPRVEKLDYYFTLPSLLITGGVLLVFAIYGLCLIGTLKHKRGIPVVRRLTPDGDINISVEAIKTITECVIKEFYAVQSDSTSVMVKDNNVDIAVRVFIADINKMSDVTVSLQNRIKEVIENNTGIVVNSVRVLIIDVKNSKAIDKLSVPVPVNNDMSATVPEAFNQNDKQIGEILEQRE